MVMGKLASHEVPQVEHVQLETAAHAPPMRAHAPARLDL
jgi:hypothetical protein